MAGAMTGSKALPAGTVVVIVLFLLTYIPPGTLQLGTLTLGFPRLFLLLSILPCTALLLFDPRHRLTVVDAFVAGFAVWGFASILVNNGLDRLEFAGLQLVETFGAYSLGRILLARPEAYRLFWRVFGGLMLLILPVGLVELLSNRFVLHDAFGGLITLHPQILDYPARLGFDRVQGNLEHFILFGVFWGFGMIHFLSVFERWPLRVFMGLCCMTVVAMSLSSGAYLGLMFQLALLAWGRVTRGRWWLLVGLAAFGFVLVDMLSDRPALVAISTRLAFSSDTAYWRVQIFEFGMRNVWANPLFGLGLNDWVRPHWLGASVDNQWLLIAMRSGLPALALVLAAVGSMLLLLLRRRDLPPRVALYRRNYVIAYVGLCISLGTVAVWSGTQAFLWLMLAMGVNLAVSPGRVATEEAAEDPHPRRLRHRREGLVSGAEGRRPVLPFRRPPAALRPLPCRRGLPAH